MKFELATDRVRTLVTAIPGEFDGHPPIQRLEIGVALPQISPDRLAVGLTLVYSPWVAGVIELPTPFSALTARRIQEWFGLRHVTPGPVHGAALPLPAGRRRVPVSGSDGAVDPARPNPTLVLRSLTTAEGVARSGESFAVASNVAMFAPPLSDKHQGLHEVGLAVLLADFVDAGVLVHESAQSNSSELTELLECVGLGLESP